MPAQAFLLSVAGLGLSLAGFAGLVAAFRRGGPWKPIDSFRLRQIPEMGLATTLLALATIPFAAGTGSAQAAIRYASAVAVAFTLFHVVVLFLRSRGMGIKLTRANFWSAGVIDLGVVGVGVIGMILGSATAYEYLLILLLARPMLAFVLVLSDAAASA